MSDYRYFHPANPEYATDDWHRFEAYMRPEWSMIGIVAYADLVVCGTRQRIETSGLWGIEYDCEEGDKREIGASAIADLHEILRELSFIREEIIAFDIYDGFGKPYTADVSPRNSSSPPASDASYTPRDPQ